MSLLWSSGNLGYEFTPSIFLSFSFSKIFFSSLSPHCGNYKSKAFFFNVKCIYLKKLQNKLPVCLCLWPFPVLFSPKRVWPFLCSSRQAAEKTPSKRQSRMLVRTHTAQVKRSALGEGWLSPCLQLPTQGLSFCKSATQQAKDGVQGIVHCGHIFLSLGSESEKQLWIIVWGCFGGMNWQSSGVKAFWSDL